MGEKYAGQGSGQRSPLSSDSLLSQSPPGTPDRVGTSANHDPVSALRARFRFQISGFKSQVLGLEFGIWDLFGIWDVRF